MVAQMPGGRAISEEPHTSSFDHIRQRWWELKKGIALR
jgi:hypothetical protein